MTTGKRLRLEDGLFEPLDLFGEEEDGEEEEDGDEEEVFYRNLVFTLRDLPLSPTEPVLASPPVSAAVEYDLFTPPSDWESGDEDDEEHSTTKSTTWIIPQLSAPKSGLVVMHKEEEVFQETAPRVVEAKQLLVDLQLEDSEEQKLDKARIALCRQVESQLDLQAAVAEEEEEEDPAAIRAKVRHLLTSSPLQEEALRSLVKTHLYVVAKSLMDTPASGLQYLEFCEGNAQYRAVLGQDEVFAILRQLFSCTANQVVEESPPAPPPVLLPTRILVDSGQVCRSPDLRKVVASLALDFRVVCLERNLGGGDNGEQAVVSFSLDDTSACVLVPLPLATPVEASKWTSTTCKWLVFHSHPALTQLYVIVLLTNPKPCAASRTAIRNLTSALVLLGGKKCATTVRLALSHRDAAGEIRLAVDATAGNNRPQWYRAKDHLQECLDADNQPRVSLLCGLFTQLTPLAAETILTTQTVAEYVQQDRGQLINALLAPAIDPGFTPREEEDEPQPSFAKPVHTLRYEKHPASSQTRLVWRPHSNV
ncbi:hypothetical protein BASA81_000475 [Batrachochytrium salamandrivorans]|nr:hypothetical protein BASA81_000475 [Batrachochytrium salamandrivorans]